MAAPSKTEKPLRSWSTMAGMRPLGECFTNQSSFWMFSMMLMLWKVYSSPYAAFSSSRMMEALWPFGVPNVRSSMPELPFRPVGLSEEDMVRAVAAVDWRMCFEVWESLWIGALNMEGWK